MSDSTPFVWTFHVSYPEHTAAFADLLAQVGPEFNATLRAASVAPADLLFRAEFDGDPDAAEAVGRSFWLELQSRCLDADLSLEFAEAPADIIWLPLSELTAAAAIVSQPRPAARLSAPAPESGLAFLRPEIPTAPLYDLLRADDPDMDRNLAETIAWIERAGLPIINLLSYLELPLFVAYAAEHDEERDQNLFLHMLHTWTCYRHYGQVCARIPASLAEVFTDPRYLRLNTTQFRSPAPALCLQLPDWLLPIHPTGSGRLQWAKEIYLTHLDPPTPMDDRELTLMIVTYDEHGEFGFMPLEVPLSLPGVGESIDAFFAPSLGDEELGASGEDLRRLTAIAATYCLYASSSDPARYLHS